jgi:uncharacterized protein (DUF305 family)
MVAFVQSFQELQIKAVQINVIQMMIVMHQRSVVLMDVHLEESALALYHKVVLRQISEV